MQPYTVLILHSHEIGWVAIRSTLLERDDIQGVSEVASHDMAQRLISAHQFDLVLASDILDGSSSVATLAAVRMSCPRAQIALFPSEARFDALAGFGTIDLAACCGWNELQTMEEITIVLDAILTGVLFTGTRDATNAYYHHVIRSATWEQSGVRLSHLDREIVTLLAQGYTSKEIAAHVIRAPHTIENRLQELRSKLGARNSAHLVHLAHRLSLLDPWVDTAAS